MSTSNTGRVVPFHRAAEDHVIDLEIWKRRHLDEAPLTLRERTLLAISERLAADTATLCEVDDLLSAVLGSRDGLASPTVQKRLRQVVRRYAKVIPLAADHHDIPPRAA